MCLVCENPSSSTLMVYVMFCMYVNTEMPRLRTSSQDTFKNEEWSHRHTNTHTHTHPQRPAARDKKEVVTESRETGRSPHARCGANGIIPRSLLWKNPSPSQIEEILRAHLNLPIPFMIENTENEREGRCNLVKITQLARDKSNCENQVSVNKT